MRDDELLQQKYREAVSRSPDEWAEIAADLPEAEGRRLLEMLESDRRSTGGDGPIEPPSQASQPASTEEFDRSIESTFVTKPPAAADKVPQQIGDYRVLNLMAVHGQGAVYRADHPHLNRQVVIKVSKHALNVSRQQEVVSEGRTLAALAHPNLAQVYDLQFEDGRPYIVMEYIEGRNLQETLKDAQMDRAEAASLIATLADAMQYAHDKGIVHRDLKPANVVIRAADGVPKVIDFGLARAESAYGDAEGSRTYGGTIAYMAPEQANLLLSKDCPDDTDERVDVFALGAILFELLTGRRLYNFTDSLKGLRLAAECEVDEVKLEDANIPASLREVCLRAIAKAPRDRYRTAAELAAALRSTMAQPSAINIPLAAAGLALAAVVLFVGWRMIRSGPEPTPTSSNETESVSNGAGSTNAGADQPEPPQDVWRGAKFTHFAYTEAGDEPGPLFENGTVREEDGLRIEVQFDAPTYCYLFAMNPDGLVQLCHPAEGDQPQRDPIERLGFPEQSDYKFEFTDGSGQQAFVLVQSEQPLPAFDVWSKKIKPLTSTATEVQGRWVWEDGNGRLWATSNKVRGAPGPIRGAAEFEKLLHAITAQAKGADVRGLSFPVAER